MIFLTVGTVRPFDRLVKAVDEAIADRVITGPVFAQIGDTKLKPKNMEYTQMLDKSTFDRNMAEADYLISHAGIGNISKGLECEKKMLVMPRMKRFREHVNDHQVFTARKFGELGHILVAYDALELRSRLQEIQSFVPTPRHAEPEAVIQRVADFLAQIGGTEEPESSTPRPK